MQYILSERVIFDADFTRHVLKFFIHEINNFNTVFPTSDLLWIIYRGYDEMGLLPLIFRILSNICNRFFFRI